jgi:DNA-binding PadR family transcriptional regulator
LGLVAEMPRHGYELERIIEQRSMREWTQIGFSSIYYVLGRLEAIGLLAGKRGGARAKKVFSMTRQGRRTLVEQSLTALRTVAPTYSTLLLGMAHWHALEREEAVNALKVRMAALEFEMVRLGDIQIAQQPLPDYLDALFDYALGQLRAEASWVAQTLDYMMTKPTLEGGA